MIPCVIFFPIKACHVIVNVLNETEIKGVPKNELFRKCVSFFLSLYLNILQYIPVTGNAVHIYSSNPVIWWEIHLSEYHCSSGKTIDYRRTFIYKDTKVLIRNWVLCHILWFFFLHRFHLNAMQSDWIQLTSDTASQDKCLVFIDFNCFGCWS